MAFTVPSKPVVLCYTIRPITKHKGKDTNVTGMDNLSGQQNNIRENPMYKIQIYRTSYFAVKHLAYFNKGFFKS